jgi:16S rRNA G966 N2-methylase RsmD
MTPAQTVERLDDLHKVLEITRAMAAVEDLKDLMRLVIDRSMELLGAERATVLRADAFKYLAGPIVTPFDLIYVAPPQYKGMWADTLHALDTRPAWLNRDPEQESGLVVVQIYPREYQDLPLSHLVQYDQRKYGSTLLCFYEPAGGDRETR